MQRLFYSYPEPLPSVNARTVTVVKSCAALQELFQLSLITIRETSARELIEKFYAVTLDRTELIPLRKSCLGWTSMAFYHFELRRLLAARGPAIIFVRHLKTAAYLLKNRRPGWVIVFESHEIMFLTTTKKNRQQQLQQLEAYVYQNVDGLVFISETLRDDLNQQFALRPDRRQIVLPLGADVPAEKPRKDFSHINEVFYTGSLHAWKGVDCLIRAMTMVPPAIKLRLVGRADDQRRTELEKLVGECGLAGRVIFTPPLKHAELCQLLTTQSKLCVLPNVPTVFDRYTSPLKLFEYMGTNNIIVYSKIPALARLTGELPMGIGVEPGSADSLAQAITAVCENPSRHEPLAENAFRLSQQYSWVARARHLQKFFQTLASPA